MYLAHTAFGMSLARIGVAMGRDRSTVAHACHAIEDRRDDPSFDAWIARLEQAVRAAPQPPVSVLAEHARRDAA
ncbi:MAG: helix-turn-helix domain-containing protein [Hyphomonadaceae bacterium]